MSKKTTPAIKDEMNIPIMSKSDKVTQIKQFLSDNYIIKVNEFDFSKTYIHCKTKKYNYQPSVDTIWLHLSQENIHCSQTLLKTLLRDPNYMETYNPIKDYFRSLEGKYKGESHIDLLCQHIITRNFGDKEDKEYYQNRFRKFFRKWLVASVACALGINKNDVSFGFINNEEGLGKSKIFEFLLTPLELEDFIFTITDNTALKINLSELFTKYFFILFDELNGIKKTKPEEFKALLSSDYIRYVPKNEMYYKKYNRIGNAAFTTNKNAELSGFLTLEMGYRRFCCVEVEYIDWRNYIEKVNVNQIWAEVVLLLNNGYEYIWNEEDWKDFEEYNSRYIIETPIMKLLRLNYRKPNSNEGRFMTSTEIMQELLKNKKVTSEFRNHISPEKIGTALTKLGFNNEKKRHSSEINYSYPAYHICDIIKNI